MSTRIIVLCAILAICVIASVITYLSDPFGPEDRVADILKNGSRIHVMCTDPECGYQQANFRAHCYDKDWPKTCPKCGKKTLLRAHLCPSCGKRTPRNPNDARTTCIHCGETVVGWPPDMPP